MAPPPAAGVIVGDPAAAVAALTTRDQPLWRLFEDLPVPILVHVDRRIAYANPASARALGVADAAEMLGHSVLEWVAPTSRATIEARMAAAARPGAELTVAPQSFVRPVDGREVHLAVKSISLLYDGRPATLTIAHDLTREVEAEREAARALAAAELGARKLEFERGRIGTLLEKAPAFIAVMRGPDHVFELVNEAYRELTGHRPLIGRPLLVALPELRGQGLVDRLDQVLATGEPFVARGVTIQVARRPGAPPEQRHVDFVYQPLIEADGERSGVFIHGVDVTDATVAQQRVRAQFHGVPVPTYVWQRVTEDGAARFALVDYNQAALTVTHGRVAAQRDQAASAAAFYVGTPGVADDLARCLDTGVTIQREVDQLDPATGERRRLFVTCAAAPPDLVLVHSEDITQRTRLEEQFRQAQKLEAIGRLAGGVAHDFNNLLSVVIGYAGLGLQRLRPGDPLADDLREIEKAGQRATGLTRQLLAFGRRQLLQPRVIDLDQIVADLRSMLERLLREDIELRVRATPDLGRVLADPGQLEQVLMNLVVNARDAMPDGGRLTIETANVELDEAYAAAQLGARPGRHVMLAVSDTGVGMEPATRARIFEPFFTTKPVGEGTGLGLATVLGIVEQTGGRIVVYSEPGHGTTFKIYLPRTDRAADVASASPAAAPAGAGETILLVEDEDQLRAVACTVLRRHGYVVLEAANGGEAFLIAQDHDGPIDLLLTDVVMPRVSGRRLADQLAAQRPGLKVLFTSGYTDDAIVHHRVIAEGVAFLQKPFTPDALLHKVREVIDPPRAAEGATDAEAAAPRG